MPLYFTTVQTVLLSEVYYQVQVLLKYPVTTYLLSKVQFITEKG